MKPKRCPICKGIHTGFACPLEKPKSIYPYSTGMPKGDEAKRGYGPQRTHWQQRGNSSN